MNGNEGGLAEPKYRFSLFLYLCIVLFITASMSAQTVQGYISDSISGEKLPSVNLLITETTNGNSDVTTGTATDIKGFYKITLRSPGSYVIKISFIGYKTQTDSIVLKSGETITKNYMLLRSEVELEQVEVYSRRDTTRQVGVFNLPVELIKSIPSFSGEMNVFGAMTHLPGVTVASELSNGLYIRGGSPDQLLILVDNVTLYNPFHLGGFASAFNSDAVEDINLLKGTFPAKYGGRLAGVLDIKLKENFSGGFKGLLSLGSITSRIAVEGAITDRLSYMISYRNFYLDKIFNLVIPDTKLPFYNFNDLNGKIILNAGAKDRVSLSLYNGKDYLYTSKNAQDAGFEIDWNNTMLNLSWLHLGGEQKFTKVTAVYTGYGFSSLIQNKNPDAYKSDYFSAVDIADIGLKIDGQYFSDERHTVKNGLELIQHNFDIRYSNFYERNVRADNQLLSSYLSTEFAGYIQDEFQVNALLFINSGVRFYYLPKSDFMALEPRLSLVYALTDKVFLKLGAARMNQFVHLLVRNDVVLPTDIWFPSGRDIKPAESDQIALGVEYETEARQYLMTIEAYYKKLNRIYDYSDDAAFSAENRLEDQLTSGTGRAYGAELFLNKRTGDLTGWIGFTTAKTERKFEKLNAGIAFPPKYDIRFDVSVVAMYRIDQQWQIGSTWSFRSGQALTMPTGIYYFPGVYSANSGREQLFLDYSGLNNYRLPAYHKLDMSVSYETKYLEKKTVLALSIYNVYNRSNAFARYLNFPHTSAMADPELKQFTLFPFFPSFSIQMEF